MGTKQNPGKFDCHGKAAPNEPIFTLRGKDPSGPYFVRAWAYLRLGRPVAAMEEIIKALNDPAVQARIGPPCEKFEEAFDVAKAMHDWRVWGQSLASLKDVPSSRLSSSTDAKEQNSDA